MTVALVKDGEATSLPRNETIWCCTTGLWYGRGLSIASISVRPVFQKYSLSSWHTHTSMHHTVTARSVDSSVSWQRGVGPLNFSLSENWAYLLDKKFSSKNTKFGAKIIYFCGKLGAKLKFGAPIMCSVKKVNSAFHPSGVGKSRLAGVKVGHAYMCRVARDTIDTCLECIMPPYTRTIH